MAQHSNSVISSAGQQYLMLHRVKKENDLNHDKWVGIGGKFEGNETPERMSPCARRMRRPV